MPTSLRDDLHDYLQQGREAVMWKLDGVSEYDARRPLVATGTNLLGLVKHIAGTEAEYLGLVFERPFPEPLPWMSGQAEANADMWARAEESRTDIVDLYRRVWAHSDTTIAVLPLETVGTVPWWEVHREATLHRVLTHLIAETHRHAGHADIVRELVDGSVGHRAATAICPTSTRAGGDTTATGLSRWHATRRSALRTRPSRYVRDVSASVRLVPMSEAEFSDYRRHAEQAYAHSIVASGMLPEPEAIAKATKDFADLLPHGHHTDGQHFWVARDRTDEVGMLWLALTEKSDGLHAFGYDFLVHPAFRRRGYGRAILTAAEQLCRERGVVAVGLSVFGANAGAQALYEASGFEVTMLQMTKRLA